MLNSGPPAPPRTAVSQRSPEGQAWLGSVVLQYATHEPIVDELPTDWKHARPAPQVGVVTVFSHGSPSAPGPAFRQAKASTLSGQHV